MKTYDPAEMEFLFQLGKNIRRLRNMKGLTQQDLASLCEKEEASLSRIERGRTNATLLALHKIATALNVGLHEVFQNV